MSPANARGMSRRRIHSSGFWLLNSLGFFPADRDISDLDPMTRFAERNRSAGQKVLPGTVNSSPYHGRLDYIFLKGPCEEFSSAATAVVKRKGNAGRWLENLVG